MDTQDSKNIIVIEGPRNTGKTFLMGKTGIQKHKLQFGLYYDKILNSDKKYSLGYSIGKDLQFLTLLQNNFLTKEKFFVDRLFLTSIVYSVLDERFTRDQGKQYLELLLKNFGDVIRKMYIVYLEGKNPIPRVKDSFDSRFLYDDERLLYHYFLNLLIVNDIEVMQFENEFTEESILNFKEFINDLR